MYLHVVNWRYVIPPTPLFLFRLKCEQKAARYSNDCFQPPHESAAAYLHAGIGQKRRCNESHADLGAR